VGDRGVPRNGEACGSLAALDRALWSPGRGLNRSPLASADCEAWPSTATPRPARKPIELATNQEVAGSSPAGRARKVREVVAALDELPDSVRGEATTRLVRLAEYQDLLGWGYGDFLGDVTARVQAGHSGRLARSVVTRSNHRIEPARLLSRAIKASRRAGYS